MGIYAWEYYAVIKKSNRGCCLELVCRRHQSRAQLVEMITGVQLAIFANRLGMSLFLLVAVYYLVAVNNPKKRE